MDLRPLLWREVTFTQREFHTMNKALVQKYGHLIRVLSIRDPMPLLDDWFVFPHCCNLVEFQIVPLLSRKRSFLAAPAQGKVQSLEFDQDMSFLSMVSVEKAIQLINCNPNLWHLKEQWAALSPKHARLFLARLCEQQTSLTRIQTSYWEIPSLHNFNALTELSPQLRQLHLFQPTISLTLLRNIALEEPIFESAGPVDPSTALTLDLGHIRELVLNAPKVCAHSKDIMGPVEICGHELTSITLSGFQGTAIVTYTTSHPLSFVRRVTKWHCPKLKMLVLDQDEFDAIHNAAAFFAAAEALQHVQMSVCTLESSIIHSLIQKHASSLQVVNLSWSTGLTSLDLMSVLTSCPSLVYFEGSSDRVLVSDLIKEPLACRRLQTLIIMLSVPPLPKAPDNDIDAEDLNDGTASLQDEYEKRIAERKELYTAVYDQLAPLNELKLIRFGGFSRGEKLATGIPWTLEAGLDKLRGLSKMEAFYVTETIAEIKVEEAEWFKRHWPRLRQIRRLDDRFKVPSVDERVLRILGPKMEVF
ncbi:hypothetical protein BGZ58_005978 [Dissophora ornata]|nr:hypothetical protein BGZ58_005978 [Dissophora ornata]